MTKIIFKFLSQFCPVFVQCANTNAVSCVAGRTNQIRTGDLYHVKVDGTSLELIIYPTVFSALLLKLKHPAARANQSNQNLISIGINSDHTPYLPSTSFHDIKTVLPS